MDKNTRPDGENCDKLKLRLRLVAQLEELSRLQTEVYRANGNIEKEIENFQDVSNRAEILIRLNRRAAQEGTNRIRATAEAAAETVGQLLELV